jgi:SAM-dependent methyltransferase
MDRRRFLGVAALTAAAGCTGDLHVDPAAPAREPDVRYVPTRDEVVEEMLKVAGVTPNDVVYDLGCGDGRIPIAAAKKFGARGVGVDISAERIAEARYNAKVAGVEDRVTFRLQDFFETNISGATVVTLYLLPEINMSLRPKLVSELKPGSRIVSHDFTMGDAWPPERTIRIGDDWIYLWTVPKR